MGDSPGVMPAVLRLAACLVVLAVGAAPAEATPTITEFGGPPAGSGPLGTVHRDGGAQQWFTEADGNAVARMSVTGVVRAFTVGLSPGAQPSHMATTSNGLIWFAEPGIDAVGRIDHQTGQIVEFSTGITPGGSPNALAVGPDGAVWFTETLGGHVGRLDPATGQITEFSVLSPPSGGAGIAAGRDGGLWFAQPDLDRIVRTTPGGAMTS